MLYDPKRWDKPTADPLTLESLIPWLENQSGKYYYTSTYACLLARYLKANGYPDSHVAVGYFYHDYGQITPIPDALTDVARTVPHTYAAALNRARAAL